MNFTIPQHTPGREYEPHEIQNAADHLMAAQKVKDNTELHAHAMKHLTQTKDTIKSIQQIRNRSKALESAQAEPTGGGEPAPTGQDQQPFPDAIEGNKKASAAVKASAGKMASIKSKAKSMA